MQGLKKFMTGIGKGLLAIVIFLVLYLSAAYIGSHIAVGVASKTGGDIAIYILTNGVHTDVVLPVHTSEVDWSREVKYANTSLQDTNSQYLALGWGDKGFYLETPQWADLKFSTAFNAAFGLSSSAIHATYYKAVTESQRCRKIFISHKQYAEMVAYIMNSFQKDADGHIINIHTKANYGIADAFYEAKGRYNLFYTCNTWANSVLKNCGLRSCFWTIFDTPIFEKYQQ